MKRATRIAVILAVPAVIAALGIGMFASGATEPDSVAQNGQPGGAPSAMPVEIVEVKSEPVRLWREFSGRLKAVDAVDLRPQVSGTLMEIRFKDGQRVKKDDVLFVIDPRPYEAAVRQAKAELAAARDRYSLADKELKRAKSLIKSSTISERVLDERNNTFSVAKSEVEAAEARLISAKIDLDHAFVKAPISGRISRAEITVGNLVQAGAGAPLLTSIVSDSEIYADFEVDERTYFEFVRTSAKNVEDERRIPVHLEVGGDNGIKVEGHIHTFDNRIDPATGTIRARALFANENGALLPGMYARVRLGSAQEERRVMLSEAVILTDQDRKFVWVVDDGKASYRQVTLGAAVDGRRVVTKGLKAGDKVIASSLMMIQPGMPVMPKKQAAEASAGQ